MTIGGIVSLSTCCKRFLHDRDALFIASPVLEQFKLREVVPQVRVVRGDSREDGVAAVAYHGSDLFQRRGLFFGDQRDIQNIAGFELARAVPDFRADSINTRAR